MERIPGKAVSRSCVICGADLEQHRSDAACCSGACRAEKSRLRRILDSAERADYRSLAERLAARRRPRA